MNNIGRNKPSLRVWVKPSATFPPFAQPTVVSYFSLDQDRRFTPNIAQLRYMHLPRDADDLGWDLNHGIDRVQRSDHAKSIERIDNLLRGLLSSGLNICPEVASFMCLRGLLTRVMTTPYEQNQGWEILVSKYRGVLFMCAQETPDQRRERMGMDDRQKRFCSWGFKFEQYMTTDQPGCPPETDMPIKEGEEFCCLFRTKLNDRRLVYGAEMDAVTSEVPLEDCLEDVMCAEFVELKTSRKLECVRQARNFKRFKLLNWWAQNFLVNVAHIICGFRDDRGIVENIAFYKVEEIPKMARDLWVPAVCMTFLDQFLSFVSKTVWDCPQSNDPNTVWRFRWEPGVHFVTGDMIPGRSQMSFLPDWFLSSVAAMNSHPLDFHIPIYSSRRGKTSSKDDQKIHTTKILSLAKDIALQRSKGKRPPSPRALMMMQRNSKPVLKDSDKSATPSATEASSLSATAQDVCAPSVIVNPLVGTEASTKQSTIASNSNQVHPAPNPSNSNGLEVSETSSSQSQRNRRPNSQKSHRRRARGDRFPHLNPTAGRTVNENNQSVHPSTHRKNAQTPRLKAVKQSVTTSESTINCHSNESPIVLIPSDELRPEPVEPSSFSSNEFSPVSHVEEAVYAAMQPLESDAYLVSHSSELSPTTSVDQYSSQAFLTPSSPEDSYSHHQLLSSSLSSPSLISDPYSSHIFPGCDDMSPTTYVVSPNSEFLQQQVYMPSATAVGQISQRSYLSSASPEYGNPSTFLSVASSDGIHSPQMYGETQEDLTSSTLLPSVATVSQTFIHSSSDISDDIQTAEGSLSTINQLSSSSYLPPSSSAEHLTLRM